MTEERLDDIWREAWENNHCKTDFETIMKTMKQAVNEALDEAARIAMDNMLLKTSKEITNLKVK